MNRVYVTSEDRYGYVSIVTWYDGQVKIDDIILDLEANHYEIVGVKYGKDKGVHTFIIEVK